VFDKTKSFIPKVKQGWIKQIDEELMLIPSQSQLKSLLDVYLIEVKQKINSVYFLFVNNVFLNEMAHLIFETD
jgi:hypothetical protein